MSTPDKRRREWLQKHKGIVKTMRRQLNRRAPFRYETVWCVDWKEPGCEVVTFCDWGAPTRRSAIDKAVSEYNARCYPNERAPNNRKRK